MRTVIPSNFLRLALTLDALVSGAVAALQLAAPNWLSELLMLPRALLIDTGAFLVAYTALLLVLARSARIWSAVVGIVVAGNVGWAASCIVLLASDMLSPNALGLAFVAVQAVAVLFFATMEFIGLIASEPASASSTARA